MIGINVAFQYGINVWNRGIFDAIEKRDASTVYFLAPFSRRLFWEASLSSRRRSMSECGSNDVGVRG